MTRFLALGSYELAYNINLWCVHLSYIIMDCDKIPSISTLNALFQHLLLRCVCAECVAYKDNALTTVQPSPCNNDGIIYQVLAFR